MDDNNDIDGLFSRLDGEDWPRVTIAGTELRMRSDQRVRRQRALAATATVVAVVAAAGGGVVLGRSTGGGSPALRPPAATVTDLPTTGSESPLADHPTVGPGSPPASPSSSPSATVTLARCTVSDLTVTLKPGSPGAGQRYAEIEVTNISKNLCSVEGFGGAALFGSNGSPWATIFTRNTIPATRFVLAPHEVGSQLLHWSPMEAKGNCGVRPTSIHITPPDETRTIDIPWNGDVVCDKGHVTQDPYIAGRGQ